MSMIGRGTDPGEDWGHAEAGLKLRVEWVKKLRAALEPFAAGTETEADRERAREALASTKEWL